MSGKPSGRATLNDRLAEFFRARPNQWVDAHQLLSIAGFAAWRTRVSDLRRPLVRGGRYEMTIENETKAMPVHASSCPAWQAWDVPGACNCGKSTYIRVSRYRYVPADTQKEHAA